jgi:hypothetical protein
MSTLQIGNIRCNIRIDKAKESRKAASQKPLYFNIVLLFFKMNPCDNQPEISGVITESLVIEESFNLQRGCFLERDRLINNYLYLAEFIHL